MISLNAVLKIGSDIMTNSTTDHKQIQQYTNTEQPANKKITFNSPVLKREIPGKKEKWLNCADELDTRRS